MACDSDAKYIHSNTNIFVFDNTRVIIFCKCLILFSLQPCATMTPTATFRWASHATATGSVRADTPGCNVALPCWCSTADRWGVSYRRPRTVRCPRHSHPHPRSWSKKGSRTSLTHHPDPTCPQALYLFLSGTGPGTNLDFTDWSACIVLLSGAKHERSAWMLSKGYK